MFTRNYARIPQILEIRKRFPKPDSETNQKELQEARAGTKVTDFPDESKKQIVPGPGVLQSNVVPDLSSLALATQSSSPDSDNRTNSRPISVFKSQGDPKWIFSVSTQIMGSLAANYPQAILHEVVIQRDYSYYFIGTISSNGWIQIIDLEKRRIIFQIDTEIPNCSWASIIHILSNDVFQTPSFVITSRELGTFLIKPWNQNEKLSLELLPIQGTYPGFFLPHLNPDSAQLVTINSEEEIISFDMKSNKPTSSVKLDDKRNITFLAGFKNRADFALIGTQKSDISLVDLTKGKILMTLELKDELMVPGQESEENPIPLCCTGNEETGNYVVGTSTPFLVRFNLLTCDTENMSLEFVDKLTIPSTGISQLCITPKQDLILGSNWTYFKIFLFTFPTLSLVREISWNYAKVYTMNVIVGSTLNEEEHGTKRSNLSDKEFYLAVGTNDSLISVWKIMD